MSDPREIARAFFPDQTVLDVRPHGEGLINDTFLLVVGGEATPRAVLQRINTRVFSHPERIMDNLRTLQAHVATRQAALPADERRLRLPEIVATRGGQDWLLDQQGGFWRALSFIGGSRTLERIEDPGQAREVGWAVGRFHRLTSDLDPNLLNLTLPGFHVTPGYLERFDRVIERAQLPVDNRYVERAIQWVEAHRELAPVLEDARRAGQLLVRVIHGDPKLDNLLFDSAGTEVLGVIDLDTVQPGLVHYDLGDCVRSCCNTAGETAQAPRFDVRLCLALLEGYLLEAHNFLRPPEYPYLYNAIRLLPFELGLRFLTDHLEGDLYFKVQAPGQNLQRALAQFRLMDNIEAEGDRIRRMVADLAPG